MLQAVRFLQSRCSDVNSPLPFVGEDLSQERTESRHLEWVGGASCQLAHHEWPTQKETSSASAILFSLAYGLLIAMFLP
jgi:hypothetical protein